MPTVYRKPSPRFILEMIAKYSLTPAACWMVGDMPSDVQAGLNAGVRTAWIKQESVSMVPEGVWLGRDFVEFEARCLQDEARPASNHPLQIVGVV
jgi:histidinol phosphatase-like enzyme